MMRTAERLGPAESAKFVSTVAELHPRTARSLARHGALSLLSLFDRVSGRTAALKRARVQILLLHHLLEDERETFRSLLHILKKDHEFISYSEAVTRIETGQIDRPYLTFSFDDGGASHLLASGLLDEVGAKACFFVCPSVIGETHAETVARFCHERLKVRAMPFMSWSDLEDLRRRGHEVGSHTMTHANLAAATPDQIAQEVGGAREVLLRRLGAADHFAWPFGRMADFSPAAERAVIDAGHVSCASGERGAHGAGEPGASVLSLRRDDIIAGSPIGHVLHFLVASSRSTGTVRDAGRKI